MIIEIKDLKKTYKTYYRDQTMGAALKSLFHRKKRNVEALKGIDFSIEQGSIVGFVGPNGAGKSTTIKILTGLLKPSGGEALVLGEDPWNSRKKLMSKVGVVFGQKGQLLWDVPPVDSFQLNQAIYSIPRREFQDRLDYLTELLDLREKILKPARELSFGERMKCEFIMSILHGPKLLFLDEPTIGLDVVVKEKIRQFILELNRAENTTIILTTHDLQDIEHLASRVIIINHGEIHFDGSLKNLRTQSGVRKTISLRTDDPVVPLEHQGVLWSQFKSPHDLELEIDTSLLPLDRFIRHVAAENTLLDLTVEELPVENIVKDYYNLPKKG